MGLWLNGGLNEHCCGGMGEAHGLKNGDLGTVGFVVGAEEVLLDEMEEEIAEGEGLVVDYLNVEDVARVLEFAVCYDWDLM